MDRFFHEGVRRSFQISLIFFLVISMLGPGPAQGVDSSGLNLNIHTDPAGQTEYALGLPVKLVMIIRNVSSWPINTERGFFQVELQRSLVITDPGEEKHALSQETIAITPLPPLYYGDQAVSPAEILPADWERIVVVDDLTELFPMMKTAPGWYTIEAQQPFIRFFWTVQDEQLGLLGVVDAGNNWQGTIDSNKIQIHIAPGAGAQLRVRVVDGSSQPSNPIGMIPVKVFNNSDISEGFGTADTWLNTIPVLEGTTDFGGWATWRSGSPCIPENGYTVITKYENAYKETDLVQGEPGWAPGCTGSIEKTVMLGAPPVWDTFSVFASNSIWIQAMAKIFSGNIGVLDAGTGLWFSPGNEILVGLKAYAADGVQIFGDSVKISRKADVYDVFYNELDNHGTIRGQEEEGLDLPLKVLLPDFPEISPGRQKVTVRPKKTRVLGPGAYGHVKIKSKGTLHLTGGIYHFKSLNMGAKSSLICDNPSEILIEGRLDSSPKASLGPSPESGLSAKDVVVFVGGISGRRGKPHSFPKVVVIGAKNKIKARIYAPNGTLWVGEGSDVEGSFIAKDVVIGVAARVRLE